jgi:hypothetical protein
MPPTSTVNTAGIERLTKRFRRLANPDATPLMVTWCRIIDEDNRKGVLAGTDKDGNAMVPVSYRPVTNAQKKLTSAQKNHAAARARRGKYLGLGGHPAGVNNNLTSAEYRKLTGPPLAPRGAFSRVITNLLTRFGKAGSGHWEAVGYWNQVLSAKGFKFLSVHFEGKRLGRNGPRIQRDLRGVRPEGQAKARKAARAWMIDMIRAND